MGYTSNECAPATRDLRITPRAHPVHVLIATVLLTSLVILAGCLAGCAPVAAGSPDATPSPTRAQLPTATATATVSPSATASASASGPCQPDTYGIYAEQTGFVTDLAVAPLPAPPLTKHGIGSTGNNASVTQGGESGVCTIGTFDAVTAFYSEHLPALGWRYSAPPSILSVCFHSAVPAQVWWKESDTFSWFDGGDAGGGAIFWSYSYCSVHS